MARLSAQRRRDETLVVHPPMNIGSHLHASYGVGWPFGRGGLPSTTSGTCFGARVTRGRVVSMLVFHR